MKKRVPASGRYMRAGNHVRVVAVENDGETLYVCYRYEKRAGSRGLFKRIRVEPEQRLDVLDFERLFKRAA
jgi:hypothetical protein